MIYGYTSASIRGNFETDTLEEQNKIIKERYPSAEIIVEKYDDPKSRPILEEKILNITPGDTIIVSKLDRFSNTIKDAVTLIESAISKNARINIINIGLIDNTHNGRYILGILKAVADFDKAMMIERTQIGKSIAKSKEGFKEGRPKKFSQQKITEALELLKTCSYKEVEEQTGISKSTLVRAKRG